MANIWRMLIQYIECYLATFYFRLILKLDFMDGRECDSIFEQLYAELPWQQRIAFKNGEEYLQPRMTAWFGDLPYVYSGITQERNPQVSEYIV